LRKSQPAPPPAERDRSPRPRAPQQQSRALRVRRRRQVLKSDLAAIPGTTYCTSAVTRGGGAKNPPRRAQAVATPSVDQRIDGVISRRRRAWVRPGRSGSGMAPLLATSEAVHGRRSSARHQQYGSGETDQNAPA
jgi:hypothetical protein